MRLASIDSLVLLTTQTWLTDAMLASASPRRRDLLDHAGVRAEVIPADIEELHRPGEAPDAFATRLALEKARAVASRIGPDPRRHVLGADTIARTLVTPAEVRVGIITAFIGAPFFLFLLARNRATAEAL